MLWLGKQNLLRIPALLVWSQLGPKPDLEGKFPDAPISFLAVGAACSSCLSVPWGWAVGWGLQGCEGSQELPGAHPVSPVPHSALLIPPTFCCSRRCWSGTGALGSPGLGPLTVVWGQLTELGFPLRAGSLVVSILPRIVLAAFATRCLQVQPCETIKQFHNPTMLLYSFSRGSDWDP